MVTVTPTRRAYLLQAVLDVWELHGGVWTQGTYGRIPANGQPVSWAHTAARAVCIVGAIERVGAAHELTRDEINELYRIVELVAGVDGTFGLERWNDKPTRTYADVRNVLRTAIEITSRLVHEPAGAWL